MINPKRLDFEGTPTGHYLMEKIGPVDINPKTKAEEKQGSVLKGKIKA